MTIIRVDKIQDHGGGVKNAWELLQTQVASSDATIDVTDVIGSHVMYKFFWSDVVPATNNREFWMRTDSDNGASFDAGTSDYGWAVHAVSMATSPAHVVTADNADAQMKLSVGSGNSANHFQSYEITLFNPSGTEYTKMKWEGDRTNSGGLRLHEMGAGIRLSAADVDAVQFLFSSGSNIASGTLKVYGLLAS